MEKPGPKTDPRNGGSGFISRDNDDPTAAAVFTFMWNARVDRKDVVIWNVVPWWDETITIRAAEWTHGLRHLAMLMEALPRLQAVVLVGKKAGRAAPLLQSRGLPVWHSAHPSARVRAAYPAQHDAIQGTEQKMSIPPNVRTFAVNRCPSSIIPRSRRSFLTS